MIDNILVLNILCFRALEISLSQLHDCLFLYCWTGGWQTYVRLGLSIQLWFIWLFFTSFLLIANVVFFWYLMMIWTIWECVTLNQLMVVGVRTNSRNVRMDMIFKRINERWTTDDKLEAFDWLFISIINVYGTE